MASVDLTKVFLHDNANQSDFMAFYTQDQGDTDTSDGEFRSYANGRTRLITTSRTGQTIPHTLLLVTRDELDKLRLWKTKALLYRDPSGRMVKGAYTSTSVTDYKDRSGFEVSITFQKLTIPFGIPSAAA